MPPEEEYPEISKAEWIGLCKEIAKDIIETYKFFEIGLKYNEKNFKYQQNGFKLKVMPKKKSKSTVQQITARAQDVRIRLNLVKLDIQNEADGLFIVVAFNAAPIRSTSLISVLKSKKYVEERKRVKGSSDDGEKGILHPIGTDSNGKYVFDDLVNYPHALICGSTKSGKSTFLFCLLLSLINYPASQVNLLLASKTSDFKPFIESNIPHLSCPSIICDADTLLKVIEILKNEIDRREELKTTDWSTYEKLPSIIFIIDEFVSFMYDIGEKKKREYVKRFISDVLGRGRHTKIHFILSTNEASTDSVVVSKTNLQTRFVFHLPDTNVSKFVLNNGSATKLKEQGDMILFYGGNRNQLRGFFIRSEDIKLAINMLLPVYPAAKINSLSQLTGHADSYKFSIDPDELIKNPFSSINLPISKTLERNNSDKNQRYEKTVAEAITWAIKFDTVAINGLQKYLKIGYDKARDIMDQLIKYGIVEEDPGTKPRQVLIKDLDTLPKEARDLLERTGDAPNATRNDAASMEYECSTEIVKTDAESSETIVQTLHQNDQQFSPLDCATGGAEPLPQEENSHIEKATYQSSDPAATSNCTDYSPELVLPVGEQTLPVKVQEVGDGLETVEVQDDGVSLADAIKTLDDGIKKLQFIFRNGDDEAISQFHRYTRDQYGIIIDLKKLQHESSSDAEIDDALLATLIDWTLKQTKISARAVEAELGISRDGKSGPYIKKLEDLGIIAHYKKGTPREVLIDIYESLPTEAKHLLVLYGYNDFGSDIDNGLFCDMLQMLLQLPKFSQDTLVEVFGVSVQTANGFIRPLLEVGVFSKSSDGLFYEVSASASDLSPEVVKYLGKRGFSLERWMYVKGETPFLAVGDYYKYDDFLWVFEDNMSTSYLLVGTQTAIMIDSISEDDEIIQKYFRSITDKQIDMVRTSVEPGKVINDHLYAKVALHEADWPEYSKCSHFNIQHTFLRDKDILDLGGVVLEVVCAPGYTPGCITLLDREHRILFSGSIIRRGKCISLSKEDLPQYIASLQMLQSRADEFDIIMPDYWDDPIPKSFLDELIEGAKRLQGGELSPLPKENPNGESKFQWRNACFHLYSST